MKYFEKNAGYFGKTELKSKEFEDFFGTPFSEKMTKETNKLIDTEAMKYQTPEIKGWFKGLRGWSADNKAYSEAKKAILGKILDKYPELRTSYETKKMYEAIGSLENRIGALEL